MKWQYDPQKAQLEHKAQVCAKFHKKRKLNSLHTVIRKRKRDAQLPARPPIRPPDGQLFFSLTTILEDNSCLG